MKLHLKYLVFLILFISFGLKAQDTLDRKNEIGVAVNKYLPDLDYENLPYFFGAEYRYKFSETEKFEHFASIRAAGNYNRPTGIKSLTSKIFIAGEIGYWAERKMTDSKWFFCWGASAGVYWTRERRTKTVTNLFYDEKFDPEFRKYYKIGVSPKVGAGYRLNETTTIQIIMAIGFGTRIYGESDHLEFTEGRGFSAQFPSLGIYKRL